MKGSCDCSAAALVISAVCPRDQLWQGSVEPLQRENHINMNGEKYLRTLCCF